MKNFGLTAREKNRQQVKKRFYKDQNTKIQSQTSMKEVKKTHYKSLSNTNRSANINKV